MTRHAGGWGLVLGDECSGAWLGRELLRATLRAHDGVDAGSPLTETVMKDFDGDTSQLVLFARDASAADFASYAPRLFSANDTGDELASVILRHAVSDLERTLTALEAASFPPLYLCGGVGERYAELLDDTFRARITKPEGDGLGGALSMAMALHATDRISSIFAVAVNPVISCPQLGIARLHGDHLPVPHIAEPCHDERRDHVQANLLGGGRLQPCRTGNGLRPGQDRNGYFRLGQQG